MLKRTEARPKSHAPLPRPHRVIIGQPFWIAEPVGPMTAGTALMTSFCQTCGALYRIRARPDARMIPRHCLRHRPQRPK